MRYIKCDLLEGDWDYAAHIANSHKVMGSGVAYYLKNKWPQVYLADETFELRGEKRLGLFTYADIGGGRGVYNLYAMWGIGNDGTPLGRNCSYDNLYNALYNMCDGYVDSISTRNPIIKPIVVGVPYLMGCCRAGGSWGIVLAILHAIEAEFDTIEFHVYRLPEFEDTAQSTQPT